MRLRPVAERDAALRAFLDLNQIIDDETGLPWRPDPLPPDESLRVRLARVLGLHLIVDEDGYGSP